MNSHTRACVLVATTIVLAASESAAGAGGVTRISALSNGIQTNSDVTNVLMSPSGEVVLFSGANYPGLGFGLSKWSQSFEDPELLSVTSGLVGFTFAKEGDLVSLSTSTRPSVLTYDLTQGTTTSFPISVNLAGVLSLDELGSKLFFPLFHTSSSPQLCVAVPPFAEYQVLASPLNWLGTYTSSSDGSTLVWMTANGELRRAHLPSATEETILSGVGVDTDSSDDGAANGVVLGLPFALSRTGRYFAFASQNNLEQLTGEVDQNGMLDVYKYDHETGSVSRISKSSTGVEGNGNSVFPSISEDGRYVAFTSLASNLAPGDYNQTYDVFRRDTVTNVTERISSGAVDSLLGNSPIHGPSMSADGASIAFRSLRDNLVEGDTNSRIDAFVWRACAEAAIAGLSPASAAPGADVALELDFECVADGPAELRLGGVTYPLLVSGGAASLLLPDLGAPLAQDLVLDAELVLGGQVVATVPAAFTWLAAKIASVTPAAAPFDQATGVVVELVGSLWSSGFGTAKFGALPTQSALLYSSLGKTFAVTLAPAAPEPGPVGLTLEFGSQSFSANRAFVYLGPGVGMLSQISGPQLGGSLVSMELVDFAPDVPVEVYFGVAGTQAVPQGLLSSSALEVLTPPSPFGGVVDVTLIQFAGQVNEKLAVLPQAWEYLPPEVLSLSKLEGAWYSTESVSAEVALMNPALPVAVQVGQDAPFAASFVDADTVSFSIAQPGGAGPQTLRLLQAGISALAPAPWKVLPALSASVTGDAASGGVVSLQVQAKAGGLVWLYAGALDGSSPLALSGIHHALELSLLQPIVSLGVAGLGLTPTKLLPLAPGTVPAGLSISLQAFAWEAPLNYAFTNAIEVSMP